MAEPDFSAVKRKAIFVIGAESSGSSYVAKTLNRSLGLGDWSARGFNCCDSGVCDADSGYVLPHAPVERLLCHRSLPFGTVPNLRWPPIEQWISTYDAWFVLCTRDRTISERSRALRWGAGRDYNEETKRAVEVMQCVMTIVPQRVFVFSYESFMLLGDEYLRRLYKYLSISDVYSPADIKDGNVPHVMPLSTSFWRKINRRLVECDN